MKIQFNLTLIFALTFVCAFGQNKKILTDKDTNEIRMRGTGVYYIDGFKVYTNLTKSDSIKILKDFVSKLNGKWINDEDKFIWEYKLDDKTFKGQLSNLDIMLAAPYVRLTFINKQIKLINSSYIGTYLIDQDTSDISIFDNQLMINDVIYHRQKTN